MSATTPGGSMLVPIVANTDTPTTNALWSVNGYGLIAWIPLIRIRIVTTPKTPQTTVAGMIAMTFISLGHRAMTTQITPAPTAVQRLSTRVIAMTPALDP